MKPVHITSEVFQVGGQGLSAPEDAAVYLVNFDGHAALIDAGTGSGTERVIENIQACNIPIETIEYILLTHCHYDHTGGVNSLRSHMDCLVVIHEAEADFLEKGDSEVTGASWYSAVMEPTHIDWRLDGLEIEVQLGHQTIKTFHIPGHSPGSVAFVAESEGLKVLFGQDVHGPLHPGLKSNRDDYEKSLELLKSLQADVLCEGHYGIIKGTNDIDRFINTFL